MSSSPDIEHLIVVRRCLENAKHFVQWAESTRDPDEQVYFAEIARNWRDLAGHWLSAPDQTNHEP